MTDDESRLADMAPALALMRIDPLEPFATGVSASADFEAFPGMWRQSALSFHEGGMRMISSPLAQRPPIG